MFKVIRRTLWIVVPLGILVGLYVLSKTRPVPVDVAVVGEGPIRHYVEEEGKTRVVDRYVVSTAVGGRLLRVDLEADDVVEAGQVVATVDPLPLKVAVAETEAQIRALKEQISGVDTKKPKPEEIERAKVLEEQATEALGVANNELERSQATWDRMKKDLVRARSLSEKRLIPQSELDAAIAGEAEAHEAVEVQEVRIKIAKLAISASRLNRTVLEGRLLDFDWEAKAFEQRIASLDASLDKLRDDLARSQIVAPVGGRVLRLLHESEQVVQAGTPILEIGNLDHLEVEADFLSEDVAHMKVGMKVEIFGRALGKKTVEGRIARIHPSAFEKISSLGVEQQRVTVVVEFDPTGTGLRDLYRVEVRVVLEERDSVALVPEGALFRHRRAWHVFVVEGDRARLRPVETGIRDGRVREVASGLAPGDTVILHPGDAVEEGIRLKALEEPAAP